MALNVLLNLSFVKNNLEMFSQTLYNNISFSEETMATYTREDIVEAALLRFHELQLVTPTFEKMYYDHYDKVGREQFRKAASVDAEAMRKWLSFKKLL